MEDKKDAELAGVPELGRRVSHVEKGPGHIDVKEVDDNELDAAEDAIAAESEFT